MEKLIIEASQDTPYIIFNTKEGILEISGKSYPDNVISFYEPLFAMIYGYIDNPKPYTKITLKLDYFNTASAKIIFDILSEFKKIHANENVVDVFWCYKDDDDEMKEAGEAYKKIIELPINIITI